MKQEIKVKTKYRVISVILALFIAVSCIVPTVMIVSADELTPPVKILADSLGDHVSIHSELQEQYLNGSLEAVAS